jgi:pimeloyl-ACP methyl ester carboxylesterase
MLYSSQLAGLVPALFHQAAQGDFTWVTRRALRARGGLTRQGDFDGLYVNITCAEDLPFIRDADEIAEAKGTFLGAYRMRQQRRACGIWPRAPVEASLHQPVRSDVPVLMINGAADPVTPSANLAKAAPGLTNATSIVVPHGGHGLGGLVGLACVDRLIHDFVERGSGAGLDTSCVAGITRPGFALKLPP